MKVYQLKIVVKNAKPPVWKRCLIPAGITFAQLSVVLEEILDVEDTDQYEFEFYQRGVHLREWYEGKKLVTHWRYDYMSASDTYINQLFEEEDWFTFRLKGGDEYRADIESWGETIDCPYPVIIKQKQISEIPRWTNLQEKNRRLREYFTIRYGQADYGSHSEIVRKIYAGEKGLNGSHSAISREDKNQKSANTHLSEIAEILRYVTSLDEGADGRIKEMKAAIAEQVCEGAEPEEYNSKITVKEYLMSYHKDELLKIAEGLQLRHFKNLKKPELAEKISNEILLPSVMKRRLLAVGEKELEAFEHAMQTGCCHQPEKDILDRLNILYNLHYVVIYEDGYVEVPDEVAATYDRINTPEYRLLHKRIAWMRDCLWIVDMFYAAVPAKILHRIYRKHPDCKVTYQEFLDTFQQIPEPMNRCVLQEDEIIVKDALRNNIYLHIKERQGDVDYYIPSLKEMMDYLDHGYPSEDPHYVMLREFLVQDLQLEKSRVEELMAAIWNRVSMGSNLEGVTNILREKGVSLSSNAVFQKFASIFLQLNSNTRMLINRGFTSAEILKNTPRLSDGQFPTIVPMTSMAADILKFVQGELDRRGIAVDYDQNATEIQTVHMPEGINGPLTVSTKKIYPNDPCPCGSGKKYKKCCGRVGS